MQKYSLPQRYTLFGNDDVHAVGHQARLLALELCDMLFSRSKAFRAALAPKLTQFLELVVGFRPDRPLPPPATAAVALRERALAAVERWNEDFGGKYRQVRDGVMQLVTTLWTIHNRLS